MSKPTVYFWVEDNQLRVWVPDECPPGKFPKPDWHIGPDGEIRLTAPDDDGLPVRFEVLDGPPPEELAMRSR